MHAIPCQMFFFFFFFFFYLFFFEIYEDMVQILLMLKVLFTKDSGVENLFCRASPGSEPSLFFSLFEMTFSMT